MILTDVGQCAVGDIHFDLESNAVAEIEILDGVDVLLETIERERDAAAALNKLHITANPLSTGNMEHGLLEPHAKRLKICFTMRPILIGLFS